MDNDYVNRFFTDMLESDVDYKVLNSLHSKELDTLAKACSIDITTYDD